MKHYTFQRRELSFSDSRIIFDEQFQPAYRIQGSIFSTSQQIYRSTNDIFASLTHQLFEQKTKIFASNQEFTTLTSSFLIEEQIAVQQDFFSGNVTMTKDNQLIATVQNMGSNRQITIHNEQYEEAILAVAVAMDYRYAVNIFFALIALLILLNIIF
ncbi:hypothetical protein [Streptococcus oriscaviae]|uniref:Uncharacterized protein n=1 Tax=Streptococcus oriscaviae TaxID=2781599 RepID=A0ABX7YLX0_9STRE|nr:hypothetical protein [Streptococcus oriscaviae]QUE54823.1 hypothetical protein INT76_02760 [Streptococcus oriscaviae]